MLHSWKFISTLKHSLKNSGFVVHGGLNTDFIKLCDKNASLSAKRRSHFKIGNLIQATVTTNDPDSMQEAYKKMQSIENFVIYAVHPFDDFSNSVNINFAYDSAIIGEITIQCSKRPVVYNANNFHEDIVKAGDVG